MDNAFWNEKWEKNEIGFHLQTIHPLLTRYLPECQLKKGNRIFVPLCGKTLDIGYLLEQGFEVVAIELNQSAVEALFRELAMVPNINDWQGVDGYQNKKFQQGNLTVYVGDFFNLLPDHVGHIDLVYDRASIVAFKTHQRRDYVK